MIISVPAVRQRSALHGYPLAPRCRQQHGQSLEHGLAPLLWPRLTSALLASLWHSLVPPSPRSKRRSPQVRTHPFSQSRLHLLHWDCCLRALTRCAASPSQHSLLCSSCSSVPTFAVPLTSDPQSPATPLRLANWLPPAAVAFGGGLGNSPVRDFHPLVFRLLIQEF